MRITAHPSESSNGSNIRSLPFVLSDVCSWPATDSRWTVDCGRRIKKPFTKIDEGLLHELWGRWLPIQGSGTGNVCWKPSGTTSLIPEARVLPVRLS